MATTINLSKQDVTSPEEELYDEERTRGEKCLRCCKRFTAFLFSTVGLTCIMVGYTFMGGYIFMELESENEKGIKTTVIKSRKLHAEKLWNVTMALNVLHPDNWTEMAESILQNYTHAVYVAIKKEGWDGNEGESELQWTFAGALLYSITVITTIGYGHIAPKTMWGQLVTIVYAIFGIPITLLTLTNLGSFFASTFRFIYKSVCCGICCCLCCRMDPEPHFKSAAVKYNDPKNGDAGASNSLTEDGSSVGDKYEVKVTWRQGLRRLCSLENNEKVSVPITVSLCLLTSYIMSGAVLFMLWEPGWDIVVGSYFCFITLTTIGFGDYVPGTALDTSGSQEKLVLVALYLFFGLALIAMCFDLMQEEAKNKFRYLGRKLGILDK